MAIHLWPDGASLPICRRGGDGEGAPHYRQHLITCEECTELLRTALVLARRTAPGASPGGAR